MHACFQASCVSESNSGQLAGWRRKFQVSPENLKLSDVSSPLLLPLLLRKICQGE